MSHHHLTIRSPAVDAGGGDGDSPPLVEVLRYVEDCHRRCMGALGTAVIIAYEAGTMLHAYRDHFQHGQWEDAVRGIVLEEGLGITLRTCQRYMKVASILGELLLSELGPDAFRDRKATRTSILKILRQRDLLSINKVLTLKKASSGKSKATGSEPAATPTGNELSEQGGDSFLTPPAILSAASEFFEQTGRDTSESAQPAFSMSAVQLLGFAGSDLDVQMRWTGSIFVHPPHNNVLPFIERMIAAIDSNEAKQGVALVPAVMDADHAGLLQPYIRGFLRDRPTFMTPSGEGVRPQTAYMLVYVSRDDSRLQEFAEAFGHLADIYYPHKF